MTEPALQVTRPVDAAIALADPAMSTEWAAASGWAVTKSNGSAPPAAADTSGAAPIVSAGDLLRNRYRLTRVLGRGGMGTVFEATDLFQANVPGIDPRLAIKVLHTQVTQRPQLLAELQREFRNTRSLSHPHIVRVFEFDRDGEVAFFTMELLSGALLGAVLNARDARPLPRAHALALIRDIGRALSHAHSRGVLHGDLTPHNIFITHWGDVRVLDFGASHQFPAEPWIGPQDPPPHFATRGFASCQLLEGHPPEWRDDVYAFACVAYILLTGEHPFRGMTALEARAERKRPRRPRDLSAAQWRLLRAGLAWERESRPADLEAWLARWDFRDAGPRLPALVTLMSGAPSRRHGATWLAPAAVVAAVLAVALGIALGWVPTRGPPWSGIRPLANGVRDTAGATLGAADGSSGTEPAQAPPVTVGVVAAVAAAPAPPGPGDRPTTASIGATAASPDDAPAAADTASTVDAPGAAAPSGTAPPPGAAAPSGTAPLQGAAQPPGAALLPGAPHPPGSAALTASTAPPPSALALTGAEPLPAPVGAATTPSAAAEARRIGFAADVYQTQPRDTVARITVHRSGNLDGPVSFEWWTEAGSGKPDVDYVSTPPTRERIPAGKASVRLLVPLVSDPSRRATKSFYVAIGSPSTGGSLGARTRAQVIIAPPSDP